MSCRKPSIRVIGSIDSLDDFTFLHGPVRSLRHCHFNCVNVICGSASPSSSFISISFSYPDKGELWPLHAFSVASYVAATTTFSCFVAVYAASCASCAFVTTASCLLFSSNYPMRSLASSFFFYTVDFSISAMSGVCHSGGHVSST